MYEALDIETIWENDIAKPICIAITKNNDVDFKIINPEEIDDSSIFEFLLEKCSSKKIYYVHNLTFEIIVFLKDMIKSKVKFKIISTNKTIYSADIWYKNKRIKLRCSYRLTLLPLKTLAEMAEMDEKGIFPYNILTKNIKKEIIIEKDMFNNIEEYLNFKEKWGNVVNIYKVLEDYCKNDAIITKKAIIKYWKIIEETGLKNNGKILTAAKLSIENYFKNNFFIKRKIQLKYDRIARESYFGGRTEVFGNLNDDEIALHYDWSGMYAQCMCEKVLGGNIYESDIIKDLDTPGFYWIQFIQDLEFPILPIKKGKLLFVNGVMEGWYWFEEILLAMKHGIKILSVKKTLSGQYYDYFLRDFVERNNKMRTISPLHKIIGKNNNNTFYGRLGMNPCGFEEEILHNNSSEKIYEKIVENNGIRIGYKKKEKNTSNVTISAAITAKARIKLYNGITEVTKQGGRILYTDTDSIIAAFKKENYKNFLDKKIGEVFFNSSLEDTIIKDCVFAMPKTYAIKYISGKEIVKIKGFNELPTFENFKKTFYNREVIETKNTEWGKKDFLLKKVEVIKKTNLYGLTKRKWSEDLKRTSPLYITVP